MYMYLSFSVNYTKYKENSWQTKCFVKVLIRILCLNAAIGKKHFLNDNKNIAQITSFREMNILHMYNAHYINLANFDI